MSKSIDYKVGDRVYSYTGQAYEFLGVGYTDDTHYYRRDSDGLIASSEFARDFSKMVRPLKGQLWTYRHPGGVKVFREILAVAEGYVVYNWRAEDMESDSAQLKVLTVEEFAKGAKFE